MALISKLVGALLKKGRITLVQPDGSRETYGPGGGKELTVRFADKRVAFDLVRNPRLMVGCQLIRDASDEAVQSPINLG